MKFETKYLIRWGIPGWVLIFWMFYEYLFLKGINPLDSKMVDITKGLTLLLSLTAVGVPIGYLLHQLYFGSAWVWNKKRKFADDFAKELGDKLPKQQGWGTDKNEDYFQIEYVWHSVLINQTPETRAYIEARYRHLLGTIHALGALFVSSMVATIISVIIIFTHLSGFPYNAYFWMGIVLQLLIFFFAGANYKYYSANLTALQIKMLKTYL
ncbi:BA5345 family protein [Rummeliibacillus sp. JY-2-4R]